MSHNGFPYCWNIARWVHKSSLPLCPSRTFCLRGSPAVTGRTSCARAARDHIIVNTTETAKRDFRGTIVTLQQFPQPQTNCRAWPSLSSQCRLNAQDHHSQLPSSSRMSATRSPSLGGARATRPPTPDSRKRVTGSGEVASLDAILWSGGAASLDATLWGGGAALVLGGLPCALGD
jgi:hypothetical protein